jgi:serine/threonine protein kinase
MPKPMNLRLLVIMKTMKLFILTAIIILLEKVRVYFMLINGLIVGEGATSNVFKASMGGNPHQIFAIKRINKLFNHKVFAQRAVREIKILRILRGHDNVCSTISFLLNYSRS